MKAFLKNASERACFVILFVSSFNCDNIPNKVDYMKNIADNDPWNFIAKVKQDIVKISHFI